MIAKRVQRAKPGSFRHLSDYILNPDKFSPESEWRRTASYILDLANCGERATSVRITNCFSDSVASAVKEIEATQKLNQRARGDKTYHLVVSFPPGEKPAPEQLIDIENQLCAAIGLGRYQRISAIHTDTLHLHIHIAINQVHPETFACKEPWYDKRKLMQACQMLEEKHGLQQTNHGMEAAKRLSPRAANMERFSGIESFQGWLKREVEPSLMTVLQQAEGWHDLHTALAGHGLDLAKRGAGLVVKTRNGRQSCRASDINRKLSLAGLSERFGAFVPPDPRLQTVTASQPYRRRPVHQGKDVDRLWRAYQQQRQSQQETRKAALSEIALELAKERERWMRWREECVVDILDTRALTKAGKEGERGKIELEFGDKMRLAREWAQKQRKTVRAAYPLRSWVTFLREEARSGDMEALSILRRQDKKFKEAAQHLASGAEKEDAETQHQIVEELRPEINRNGHVIYKLRDGGVCVDRGLTIEATTVSPYSLELYCRFAAQWAGPYPISDNNTSGVRALVDVSVISGLDLTFETPTLQQRRENMLALIRSDARNHSVISYIVEQNCAQIEKHSGIEYEVWDGNPIEAGMLDGLVRLHDGSEVALIRSDKRIIVVQSSAEQIAHLKKLTGHHVALDSGGTIRETSPPNESQLRKRWWQLS